MQNLTWHRRDSALFFFGKISPGSRPRGSPSPCPCASRPPTSPTCPKWPTWPARWGPPTFWGVCGAAAGVGLAFGILLRANPLKPRKRRLVQEAVQAVLTEFSSWEAARCCQRECWLALRRAAELSRTLLPLPLTADAPLVCRQSGDRPDCLQSRCPLWDHQGAKAGFLVRKL